MGVWVNNEFRLADEITLRTEIGLDAELFNNGTNDNPGVILAPVLNVEPRWYYNIKKRASNNKRTANNSSNFLTISFQYHPDWFVFSKKDNVNIYDQLAIIPKWGIRRSIANSNFNYEAGAGLGYRLNFLKQYGYTENDSEIALDIHLRIGYTFK